MPRLRKRFKHLAHIRTLAIASSAQKRLERAAAASNALDEDDDAPWFPELGTDVAYTPEPAREPEVLPEKRRTRAPRYPVEIALPMRNTKKTRKQKDHLKKMRELRLMNRGRKRERSVDGEECEEGDAANGDGVESEGISRDGLMDLVEGVIGDQGGEDGASASRSAYVSREELLGLLEGALDIQNYDIIDTLNASASAQLVETMVSTLDQNDIRQQGEEVLVTRIRTTLSPSTTLNEQPILLPSIPAFEGTSAADGTFVTPAQDPPPRMFQLKQWNPKTDGKHLPALRGRAGTGNSERNVRRKKAKAK